MLNALNRIFSVPFFNINPPGDGTLIRLDVERLKTGETFEQCATKIRSPDGFPWRLASRLTPGQMMFAKKPFSASAFTVFV